MLVVDYLVIIIPRQEGDYNKVRVISGAVKITSSDIYRGRYPHAKFVRSNQGSSLGIAGVIGN